MFVYLVGEILKNFEEMDKILEIKLPSEKDPILCNHCKRTTSNGVRCLGMCVADNDY